MPKYNPERRAWRGKSYRKGGTPLNDLRDAEGRRELCIHHRTQAEECVECSEQKDCYDLQT